MSSQDFLQGLMQGTANFEALVTQLMSPENDARNSAEQIFNGLKTHPDACFSNLIRGLRSFGSSENRSYCAIMLRKVITSKDDSIWEKTSPDVKNVVKSELLNCLNQEPERGVVNKVCDTIYELGDLLLSTNEWPELLPTLLAALQPGPTSNPRSTESALIILGDLAEESLEQLRPSLPQLYTLLATHLASPDKNIALAALNATGSLIQALDPEPREQAHLQPMLPAMLQVLTNALNGEDESSARNAMELFIEVAENNPKFLRPHLVDCVQVFITIGRAEQLDSETRILAVAFLVTLCEARERAPGMMRKLPTFVQTLFETLMQFLLDVEDDEVWHTTDEEDSSEGEGELAQFGQECLDRIAMSLGGKSVVPPAAQMLTAWLGDSDWRKRHATLLCLAQIAEGCSKVMLKQLDGLVQMCLKGLQDPHPRVRWAACQALGQMCSDLGPDLQERFHKSVVPALLAAMDNFDAPRVQAHSAAALVNFSEMCEPELLAPYLDTLIQKLQALLQRGKKMVQEGALTALASVADAAQSQFIRYYDEVMPKLTHILLHANDKTHRLLRAKALECVSLVGMAVGRDKFRGDAIAVMRFMEQLQAAGMDADDPTSSYMLQAGARLCKCLGEEMVPYLGVVMPPLLASASQQPDVKVKAADDVDDDDDDDDVEHVQVGDKLLSIRTSTLEDKATAVNMLCCYADELKGAFYPYVQEVAPLMVGLLKFYFHEEVRRAAVQSLPALLKSVSEAVEAGKAQPSVLKDLADFCWPALLGAMRKEPDPEVLACMLESIGEMVAVAGQGHVQQGWVEQSFGEFKEVMEQSEKRRRERLEEVKGEELDEEDREALEEREAAESEVLDNTASAVGAMLKVFGDAVLPYVEQLMPLVAPLLSPERSPEDRRIALCIVDDLIDHSAAGRDKYLAQTLPILLECSAHADEDLRQCAVYGLGIAAAKAPLLFKPFCTQVVQQLVQLLSSPDARSDDYARATDNAASALGKILEHHVDAIDNAAVSQLWVNYLPLKDDKEEACLVHEQLLRLVEAQDPRIVAHLPRVAEIFVVVLAQGTKLISREAGPRAVSLLQRLQSAVPAEVLQGAMGRLTPEEQQRLQAAMAGQFVE